MNPDLGASRFQLASYCVLMKKVVRFIQLEENRYVFTPISTQELLLDMPSVVILSLGFPL